MLARTGKCIVIAAVLAIATSRAEAQLVDPAQCGTSMPPCTAQRTSCCVRNFTSVASQKAILIPTDRCHQPFVNSVSQGGPDRDDDAPEWCHDDPPIRTNSQTYVFGLIYRLMQNKIPVYWIVNPTKAPSTYGITATSTAASTKDVDFWILTSTGTPPSPTGSLTSAAGAVTRLSVSNVSTASMSYSTADTYGRREFPVRGGAFLIAPEDRAAFDNFMRSSLGRTTCGSGNDCYDFINNNGLYLWEIQPGAKLVWQDYTQPLVAGKYYEYVNELPVALRVDYAPPKVAVVEGTSQMTALLSQANLNDLETTASCKTGTFTVNKSVGCQLTENDVTALGRLVTSSFDNAWIDLGSPSSCSGVAARLQTFATAIPASPTCGVTCARNGGNIIMFGDSITIGEQCAASRGALLGRPGTGLIMHGTAINDSDADPLIVRYPSNVLSQYGDLPLNFTSGSVKGFDRVSGTTDLYNPLYYSSSSGNTLRRLVTQELVGTDCANHKDVGVVNAASSATCDGTANNTTTADYRDVFAYGRYLNDKRNGVIFYSPGNNPNNNPVKGHTRLILGTLLAVPPFLNDQVFNNIEVARNNPIVGTIGGTSSLVQGTFEYRYKVEGTCSVTTSTVCDVDADCPSGQTCVGTQFTVPRAPSAVYGPDDVGNFSFPFLVGHLRATAVASTTQTATGTSVMSASTGESLSTAGDTFPPVVYGGCTKPTSGWNGSCRAVWTTTVGGLAPPMEIVGETNTAVSSKMLPDAAFTSGSGPAAREAFVRKILKGYDNGTGYVAQLGGIDRSTVAVIGPGASVGATRPTIAYVGATDGMLHAICASVGGPCTRVGMELWAYIPRTNLPLLRYNLGRIDTSPHVLDAKLTVGAKTVLLLQAGSDPDTDGATPAIYALDISDPGSPSVLWEYATFDSGSAGGNKSPVTRPTNGLGIGLSLAAGQVTIAGVTRNLVFAHTNNGGSGANGSYVIAIDMNTGEKVWDRFYQYPSASGVGGGLFGRGAQPAINIPPSAIPHGPVTIDTTRAGRNATSDQLVVADLYGNVWLLDPENGVSLVKTSGGVQIPLFQFRDDYHPTTKPAVYANAGGELFAVFTTGGYHDYSTEPLWGSHSPAAKPQMVASVRLPTATDSASPFVLAAPFHEATGGADVPFVANLTGFGFSQARVIGEEVFVTTDTSNINAATFGSSTTNTGRLVGFNITNPSGGLLAAITQNIAHGAGQIINDGADVFLPNRLQMKNATTSGDYVANYTAGERTTPPPETTTLTRKLWLRTE